MIKRDDSPFASGHAREAINFNLSMFIYACVATAIGIALVGVTVLTLGLGLLVTLPAGLVLLLAIAAIAVTWLVCSIVATITAWNGEEYRYPFTIRLLLGPDPASGPGFARVVALQSGEIGRASGRARVWRDVEV